MLAATATRRLRFALGAGLLLLVALAASAEARPLVTGLSGVYDYNSTAYGHVRASGAQFVRIGVPWGSIAPAQRPAQWNPEDPGDPNYSWGHVDGAVRYAVEAGLEPLLMVSYAPTWAQGCDSSALSSMSICKPDAHAFAQFATAVARRFSGSFGGLPRVRYWQGLNEPNLSLFFAPQFEGSKPVSAELYRPLANAFYAAVKAVDPDNLVLAAGLGPNAVPKYTIGPLQFTRELLCMKKGKHPKPKTGDCGGGVSFDIFDIHPYTTGSPTHEGRANDVQLGDLPELQALLRAADRAGRINGVYKRTPLWITEFSYDTKPPDPGGLQMRIAARWTAEALHRAWSAGVDHFFWYSLRDEPIEPGVSASSTEQAGLYFRGVNVAADRPKTIFYVFRFPFVAYPRKRGLSFWGRTPTSAAGKVLVQVKRGRKWRTVRRLRADRHGIFHGLVRIGYGRNHRGGARAVFRSTSSVGFSMKPVKDFYQPPFGRGRVSG